MAFGLDFPEFEPGVFQCTCPDIKSQLVFEVRRLSESFDLKEEMVRIHKQHGA
jgi:hypothetical protein